MATSYAAAASLSTIRMDAPRRASACAVARPIPLAAPVMIAAFPIKLST